MNGYPKDTTILLLFIFREFRSRIFVGDLQSRMTKSLLVSKPYYPIINKTVVKGQ